MKKIKALYVGMAMTALAASLTSCQADMDAPELVEPKATMEANTTISDFKTAFADKTMLCPMKDEATQTPYIIKGRVISSDATGNIYKSIVIQDETAALAISINQGSTYTDYRLGQEIVLNATGLYIGYYNGLQQIGWLDEYQGAPSLTFLAWDFFLAHSELNGFPNQNVKYVGQDDAWPAENPYCIVTTFSKLPSTGEEFRNMQSQLVEFRNVYFEEGGKETYAPYQESVNRTLKDSNGGSLTVRTSGYSNFYNEIIPEGTGIVRGILSYYGDGWQLLLRGLDDVKITEKGQKKDPYTVAEAIEAQNEGMAGWVSAYIVGSVKAGVNTVTSNNDIIFGADAEMVNNLIIAASADVKDWTQCIAVELPQGSAFRASANLVENPGVLGQEILVNGTLSTYLGMPGLTGNGGTANDVEIPGVTIENPTPDTNGNGSQDKPYSASQINGMSTVTGTNLYTGVWATGYIVGYVDTGIKSYATDESAKFTAPATVATNLLLANDPNEKDWNKCISVNLPSGSDSRSQLNLKDNPGNLGKLLIIKGNVTKYVGLSGVKEPSEFSLGEGGGGDTPTPPVSSSTIYSALNPASSDLDPTWKIDNADKPSGVSNIWSWKIYSNAGYLNASAYVSNVAYASTSYCYSGTISLEGYKSASMNFEHAAKFQTTCTKLCKVVIRETGTTAWTELNIPVWPAAGAWTFANSGDIDLSAFLGKKVEIGFKYASTTAGADTWEIKNLNVTAGK